MRGSQALGASRSPRRPPCWEAQRAALDFRPLSVEQREGPKGEKDKQLLPPAGPREAGLCLLPPLALCLWAPAVPPHPISRAGGRPGHTCPHDALTVGLGRRQAVIPIGTWLQFPLSYIHSLIQMQPAFIEHLLYPRTQWGEAVSGHGWICTLGANSPLGETDGSFRSMSRHRGSATA